MSSSEGRQERVNEVVRTYQRFPGDTGSTEVQGETLSLLESSPMLSFEGCVVNM